MHFMQLTKNFTLSEMTYSPTAVRRGMKNIPNVEHINNMVALCRNVLQPIRDHFGSAVKINSGYRCHKLNKIIGGSRTSQHRFGQAADFVVPKKDLRNVFQWIVVESGLQFDQAILEFGRWIHISFREDGKNRNQILLAYKVGKRTRYKHLTKEIVDNTYN